MAENHEYDIAYRDKTTDNGNDFPVCTYLSYTYTFKAGFVSTIQIYQMYRVK